MAAVSSEKIDLIIYGPTKKIVDNGFPDQFVLHHFETTHDLERLTPDVAARARGMAVTYNTVRGDAKTLGRFPSWKSSPPSASATIMSMRAMRATTISWSPTHLTC